MLFRSVLCYNLFVQKTDTSKQGNLPMELLIAFLLGALTSKLIDKQIQRRLARKHIGAIAEKLSPRAVHTLKAYQYYPCPNQPQDIIDEMVPIGLIEKVGEHRYAITDKGRAAGYSLGLYASDAIV